MKYTSSRVGFFLRMDTKRANINEKQKKKLIIILKTIKFGNLICIFVIVS